MNVKLLLIRSLGWTGIWMGWSHLPTAIGCVLLVVGCLLLVAAQIKAMEVQDG